MSTVVPVYLYVHRYLLEKCQAYSIFILHKYIICCTVLICTYVNVHGNTEVFLVCNAQLLVDSCPEGVAW